MPKSNQNKIKSTQKTLGRRLAPWVLLVLVLFAVGLVVGQFATEEKQVAVVAEDTTPQPVRDIILYFSSADGQTLVAESTSINDCVEDDDCLRETVDALIAGPKTGLIAVLPPQVTLLSATAEDSLITLDFSKELVSAHPGGTQSELLTIYALVDTLTANFPHLRQLQILVEGAPVETIKGHVDLRHPIYPDFSFVEEGVAPIGKVDNLPEGRDE